MRASSVFFGILLALLCGVVVFQNPEMHTIRVAMLDVTATVGITCVSAFGFGILTGVIAVLTRDVPRMRRLRTVGGEES